MPKWYLAVSLYEKQTFKASSRKKKFFFLISFLTLLLIFLISFSHTFTQQTNLVETQTPNFMLNPVFIQDVGKHNRNTKINNVPSVKESIESLNLPKAKFSTWSGFDPIDTPSSSSFYQLKSAYSLTDVKALAQKLSTFDTIKDYENYVMSYTIGKQGQVASILLFKKNSGEFSYSATPGIALSSEKNTMDEKIYDFLKKIDWYDPTLKIIASYKLHSDSDTTYFEIKRDWKSTGLPILNPIGLLNLDENVSINNLEQNDRSTSIRTNSDIYQTSDNKDGLERNTDFNTMTLGISNNTHSVVVLNSNIRKMDQAEVINTPVISYQEAVSRLKNNEQSFILTTPSNVENVTEWKKFYPNQLAEAKQATITESAMAYLEQSPATEQKTLEPYYIFRGKAQLTNNFEINFIAAVSAIHKTVAYKPDHFSFSFIPPVYADNGTIGQLGNQKQGAFDLILTPPAPTPTPPPFAKCVPAKEDLNPLNPSLGANNTYYGWSPIAIINGEVRISKKGWWYFVPSDTTTDATLKNDVGQVLIQIQTIVGQRNFRNFNTGLPPNILSDYQTTRNACPIRVTGDSPTIFIYAPANTHLTIKPPSAIRYAEPILKNNIWNILSNGNGSLLVNTNKRNYLYYEYSGVTFSKPDKGWVIKKEDVNVFAKKIISPLLKLTAKEQERLLYELNHAAKEVNSNTLFIGAIDQNELDTKLPLTIDAQPKLYRYFFYIGKPEGTYQMPTFSPIERSEYMIVELGSYAEK